MHFGDWTPFVAVLLHPDKEARSNKEKNRLEAAINEGRHVFLNFGDDGYQGFLFTVEGNSQPLWHVVYAKSGGMFRKVGEKERVASIRWTERCGADLSSVETDVQIVGQLRYEYALNLLNKVAGSFSRVGLDFVGKIV